MSVPAEKIALASIYIDRGEGIDYALAAAKRMSRQQPTHYYLDVLCRVDQVDLAARVLRVAYGEIRKLNPQLHDENIVIGLTTNEDWRPAAISAAQRHALDGELPAFKDINPGRKRD